MNSVFVVQIRGMATLKDIAMRLKSVKNIQKITSSMKMVSAAKYNKAERALKPARPYGLGAKAFYEKAEITVPEEETASGRVFLAITSDRGLCGAANSSVVRAIKEQMNTAKESKEQLKIVAVGDKARSALQRLYSKNILMHFNEVGKKPATFRDASTVAEALLTSDFDFGKIQMYYNTFKSVVAYNTTEQSLFSLKAVSSAEKMSLYDSIDDDIVQSYNEFVTTSLIFYAMKEGQCSEQSARMTAMDAASKNAGEMIDKLTLTYNRTRQAAITRELTEIVSGASCV